MNERAREAQQKIIVELGVSSGITLISDVDRDMYEHNPNDISGHVERTFPVLRQRIESSPRGESWETLMNEPVSTLQWIGEFDNLVGEHPAVGATLVYEAPARLDEAHPIG